MSPAKALSYNHCFLGRRKVKKPVSNPNEGRANLSQRHIDAVQAKNNQMAEALNQAKIQNGVLKGQIKTLHSENLELRVENATQRDEMRRQQVCSSLFVAGLKFKMEYSISM